MRGVIFNAPGDMRVETVPDPEMVAPTDVIVRVTKAGICGSDLHIYHHGDAFGFTPGCRVGHEFVGVVEEVGRDVRLVNRGDKVASPFWISCGICHFCRQELHTSCSHGGAYGFQPFWPAAAGGGPVEGGQSERVRVPFADGTLERVPESLAGDDADSRVLPLTDVFATGYHAATLADIRPGDTVAVIGDGAVGLCAAQAASLFGAAAVVLLGHHDDRLALGRRMGATDTINTTNGVDVPAALAELSSGLGPSAVLATIANSEAMHLACEAVRPGGTVSYVGMEMFLGAPEVPWTTTFLRNVTIRGGITPVRRYLRHFWPLLESGRIDPSPVLTHDLALDDGASGYELMATRAEGAVKVALTPSSS
jgi:threonine dehydrogenase-like Zn-dependent dehydrogenase